MKRIKEISADDFVAVVEPNVHTKTLQDARAGTQSPLVNSGESGIPG